MLLQGTDMKIRRGLEDKFLLLSLLNVGMGDSKILGLPVWLRAAQVVRGLSECGKRSLTGGKARIPPDLLLRAINNYPVLFSFYSLFQAISDDLLSALGQLC